MNKLMLIIRREFLAKVKNRSFIVMTFVSPLLMVGMMALVGFLTKSSLEKKSTVAYVNESELFTEKDFPDNSLFDFEDLSDIGLDKAKTIVTESGHEGLLYIPKSDSVEWVAEHIQFFSKEAPGMVTIEELESVLESKLHRLKVKKMNIDLDKLDQSKVKVDIGLENFSGVKSSKFINGVKMAMGIGAGYLVMMFIIIYGASVMRSVIEEKTSRIIEVIISSVKPFQLMLGKIIGTASAGLLQFIIWGILLAVILLGSATFFDVDIASTNTMSTSTMAMQQVDVQALSETQNLITELLSLPLISMFFSFILYFLCGYLLYSSIYAAIGAAVDNETDTQQFMFPVLMPLMIGVYVGFATVINDPHGMVSTVFSLIPLTSPIVMLMRIPFGVPFWQLALSLSLLIVTFLGAVWLAAKIYRIGILMYGKKASYKEIYKWIKY